MQMTSRRGAQVPAGTQVVPGGCTWPWAWARYQPTGCGRGSGTTNSTTNLTALTATSGCQLLLVASGALTAACSTHSARGPLCHPWSRAAEINQSGGPPPIRYLVEAALSHPRPAPAPRFRDHPSIPPSISGRSLLLPLQLGPPTPARRTLFNSVLLLFSALAFPSRPLSHKLSPLLLLPSTIPLPHPPLRKPQRTHPENHYYCPERPRHPFSLARELPLLLLLLLHSSTTATPCDSCSFAIDSLVARRIHALAQTTTKAHVASRHQQPSTGRPGPCHSHPPTFHIQPQTCFSRRRSRATRRSRRIRAFRRRSSHRRPPALRPCRRKPPSATS